MQAETEVFASRSDVVNSVRKLSWTAAALVDVLLFNC